MKFEWVLSTFLNSNRSIISDIIDNSIEELNKRPADYAADREASVLEKLLKIDRQIAVVMAYDMLVGGIDTVNSNLFLVDTI